VKANSVPKATPHAESAFGTIGFLSVLMILMVVVSSFNKNASTSTTSLAPKEYSLIYVSETEGNKEISILDLSTRVVRNLTKNAASDVSPCWWPLKGQIVFGSSRTGQGDIYTMKIDGSDQTLLIGGPATQDSPMISPDGKKLVYVEYVGNQPNIKMRELETGAEHTVGQGLNPAWSPDNRRISFDASPSGGPVWFKEAIFIVDALAPSSKAVMLEHPGQGVHGYAESYWHPNARLLLYVTGFGANRGLVMQDLSAKLGGTISEGLGHDRYPSASPDGEYIACVSNLSKASLGGFFEQILPSSRSWGLVVIRMTTDFPREKVISSGVSLGRPVWVKTQ
jgi:Tol biopolymer transport system component